MKSTELNLFLVFYSNIEDGPISFFLNVFLMIVGQKSQKTRGAWLLMMKFKEEEKKILHKEYQRQFESQIACNICILQT